MVPIRKKKLHPKNVKTYFSMTNNEQWETELELLKAIIDKT